MLPLYLGRDDHLKKIMNRAANLKISIEALQTGLLFQILRKLPEDTIILGVAQDAMMPYVQTFGIASSFFPVIKEGEYLPQINVEGELHETETIKGKKEVYLKDIKLKYDFELKEWQ